jgi:phosphopantetheine--protein transferase-like protein
VAVRVGIDLVALGDVRESLRVHADRWLARVLTDPEAADCRVAGGIDAGRVAARFAAKEAVLKVLRPDAGTAIPWRAIEVRGGRLALDGPAAARAADAGIGDLALSLTRAGEHAAAFVLAEVRSPVPRDTALQRSARSTSQPMNPTVHDDIRRVIDQHGRLSIDATTVAGDTDLYEAGMTSHASVNVMLALEDAFDVEFPDRMLKRDVFESVDRIAAAVAELRESA